MRNIIVAGAGHGGLAAAAMLAKAGYQVTVYEKKTQDALGYDWHDRFTFSILAEVLEMEESDFPEDIWEYRGNCAFISPAKRKSVNVYYTQENRQKIMLRKPLLDMLLKHAENNGVHICFGTQITAPIYEGNTVEGIRTDKGDYYADLIIDAAGAFSPLRTQLPKYFHIETAPKSNDVFFAYRAYFEKTDETAPEFPFEVYLRHNGEQGLSWFYTADHYVDILIGRTQPINDKKIQKEINLFRQEHPWFSERVLRGGIYGVIPVRRPLTLFVANGYAAVGDSAFMTTPMNGMGIDLSLLAGKLLADTVINSGAEDITAGVLWEYNRDFHMLYGGDTAKNEGLKNALLKLPAEGVDFLFENEVIQAADLAGGGKNVNLPVLLGKLKRGMKKPQYFSRIVNGLIKGSKACSLYKTPPLAYDLNKIIQWSNRIKENDI